MQEWTRTSTDHGHSRRCRSRGRRTKVTSDAPHSMKAKSASNFELLIVAFTVSFQQIRREAERVPRPHGVDCRDRDRASAWEVRVRTRGARAKGRHWQAILERRTRRCEVLVRVRLFPGEEPAGDKEALLGRTDGRTKTNPELVTRERRVCARSNFRMMRPNTRH